MEVVPVAITKSETLNGTARIGAAVELTMYQKELKSSWKALSEQELRAKDYRTNVTQWMCCCGAQKMHPQHLCKHLVQAVDTTTSIFSELTRQHTMPLYEHPSFGNAIDDTDGSISAGDDFIWMGRHCDLSGGKWRSIIQCGASLEHMQNLKRRPPSLSLEPESRCKQVRIHYILSRVLYLN